VKGPELDTPRSATAPKPFAGTIRRLGHETLAACHVISGHVLAQDRLGAVGVYLFLVPQDADVASGDLAGTDFCEAIRSIRPDETYSLAFEQLKFVVDLVDTADD
jgi:hypothetical protein